MNVSRKYLVYVLGSTFLWLMLMISSSTELISWSVWAQNLTPGMSAIAVKIFGSSLYARLILSITTGLFSILFGATILRKKQLVWYTLVIVIMVLIIHYLGAEQVQEFHIFIVLYLILLQIPLYVNASSIVRAGSGTILTSSTHSKLGFFWMIVVLIFGMTSFYFHFQHPERLLPVNFEKYGWNSQIFPYLLHFSVLGNFICLTVLLFFISNKLSSLLKLDYLKVLLEVVLFLLFVSFIVRGIFSELYHEIEITESRFILITLPFYIPVIFSPLILTLVLKYGDDVRARELNVPLLIMYIIGSLPARILSSLFQNGTNSNKAWNTSLIVLSIACFAFTIYIFRGLIFDPWYTVLSPIKGFVYATMVWIGSTLIVVLITKTKLYKVRITATVNVLVLLSVMVFSLTIPRYFHKNPGLKGLLVQYSESIKMSLDGLKAFYPELVSSSLLKAGQNAKVNTTYSISPGSLDLMKKREGILNDSISYIYVMADAMRGDFYEGKFAEYDSLYPYMREWIDEECVWFRKAYSQSNGSYLGIPALFGSHGNRSVLKPSAKNENRFFQLLKHDGIEDIYSIEGNSLHNIYPDNIKIRSLGKIPEDFGAFDRNVTAMELLNKLKLAFTNRPHNQPFFAYFLLMDTHNDYVRKEGIPDFGNRSIDLYAHNIRYVDYFMKELIDWLKEIGAYENTVIILNSDHGEEFKEHESTLHGHNFFEEVMRVPVIMKLPNVPPRSIDIPILNSDIFPTIATLRGYDIESLYNYEHLGIDLSEMILDENVDNFEKRDMLFISSQNTKHALFRDGRYKMIYWPKYESYVFYDLLIDEKEYDNRIVENGNLAKEMHQKMLNLINETSGETYSNSWPIDL